MQEGDIIEVRVVAVHPHGIDVEAQGARGFIQPIELSWDPAVQPHEVAKAGDALRVRVYATTDDRFFASVRQASPEQNPWGRPDSLGVGTVHQGVVRTVVDWGWSVEITPGVTGMILAAKWPGSHRPGEKLTVEVLACDPTHRKLELKPL